ncbi:hypothetical protein AC578_5356 [Pseudocercospora eumusae]|uniref:Uncharacterized protein n=1 Tax=Pseudocercospora eumusae TaxID=321146 RepID=A0A139H2W3_9PEZI|nr:hypothetical protein AC578_5356 [Pseudocercospora eumusae]
MAIGSHVIIKHRCRPLTLGGVAFLLTPLLPYCRSSTIVLGLELEEFAFLPFFPKSRTKVGRQNLVPNTVKVETQIEHLH